MCLRCSPRLRRRARRHDPEKLPATRIQDLQYGDVLFYYYQEDDFEALTRLLAYQHWTRCRTTRTMRSLLPAGCTCRLGMYNEAGDDFRELLTMDVPTGVRNRAWFYLGKIWYARGYLDKAEDALRKIKGAAAGAGGAEGTPAGQRADAPGQASTRRSRCSRPAREPPWLAYAQFNLGVALVRAKRLAEADPYLTAVGTMVPATTELLALRDRANLALGFAYLQANQPARRGCRWSACA